MRLSLLVILAMAPCAAAADWPTFQGNAAHDGHVAVSLDPSGFGLEWEIAAGDGTGLNPVVAAEGKVFVTTTARFADGGLYVYDAVDGSYVWHVTFGDVASVNDPAYADGRVYAVGGYHGYRFLRAADTSVANVVGTRVFAPASYPDTNGIDAGAVIRAPSLYFYQIVGVCADGTEGPIE